MPTADEINVQSLLARVATGDIAAYTTLYNENYDRVYVIAYAYSKDAELAKDIAQQVFIKTWERSAELAEMESPLGWMCATAKFLIINTLKKQVASRQYLERWFASHQQQQEDPSVLLNEKLLAEKIQHAISGLPGRQREVYLLSREEGLTYEQIAERLQIGKETVKEHMARALKAIRQFLEKEDPMLWLVFLSVL